MGVCSSNSLATRRGTRNLIYILLLFFLIFLQLPITQQLSQFCQLLYFYSTSSSIVAVLIAKYKNGHRCVSILTDNYASSSIKTTNVGMALELISKVLFTFRWFRYDLRRALSNKQLLWSILKAIFKKDLSYLLSLVFASLSLVFVHVLFSCFDLFFYLYLNLCLAHEFTYCHIRNVIRLAGGRVCGVRAGLGFFGTCQLRLCVG